MDTFIIYNLKVAACLTICLVTYQLFLRNATFFRFNRGFLILGIVMSFITPLFPYTYDIAISIPANEVNTVIENQSTTINSSVIDVWSIIFSVYFIGAFIIIWRHMKIFKRIKVLIDNGNLSENERYKFIENANVESPFTILNYVFFNSEKISDIEKNIILKHEITHINQKHWIDLFCVELMIILQWFNPTSWIYMSLFKENHEFLADKAVIDSGISPTLYQAVLINQKFQTNVFSFSNSFNYSKPLNRLFMIKKSKSPVWKRALALTIIPLFGALIWLSAEPRYVLSDNFSVNTQNWDSMEKKPVIFLNGKEITETEMTKIHPDDISLVEILKDDYSIEKYGEKAKNGVIIITAKDIKTVKDENNKSAETMFTKELLVIIDGVEADMEKMKALNPDKIENINVLKGESATTAYGEKGTNGVILITTKK